MKYVDTDKDIYDRQKEHSTFFKVEIVAFIILIISLALSFPILIKATKLKSNLSGDRKETVVDKIINRLISDTTKVALPTRFIVPERYLLPPSDQASRGVCWAFATIFLLESQYRANGIEKGFLNPNEYVNFSKQAYAKYLFDKCKDHKEVAPCNHGGFGKDPMETDDHKIDSCVALKNFHMLFSQRKFAHIKKQVMVKIYVKEWKKQSKSTLSNLRLSHSNLKITYQWQSAF